MPWWSDKKSQLKRVSSKESAQKSQLERVSSKESAWKSQLRKSVVLVCPMHLRHCNFTNCISLIPSITLPSTWSNFEPQPTAQITEKPDKHTDRAIWMMQFAWWNLHDSNLKICVRFLQTGRFIFIGIPVLKVNIQFSPPCVTFTHNRTCHCLKWGNNARQTKVCLFFAGFNPSYQG